MDRRGDIKSASQRKSCPMTWSRAEGEARARCFAGDLGEGPCAHLPVCEGEATKKGKRNSTEDSAYVAKL